MFSVWYNHLQLSNLYWTTLYFAESQPTICIAVVDHYGKFLKNYSFSGCLDRRYQRSGLYQLMYVWRCSQNRKRESHVHLKDDFWSCRRQLQPIIWFVKNCHSFFVSCFFVGFNLTLTLTWFVEPVFSSNLSALVLSLFGSFFMEFGHFCLGFRSIFF